MSFSSRAHSEGSSTLVVCRLTCRWRWACHKAPFSADCCLSCILLSCLTVTLLQLVVRCRRGLLKKLQIVDNAAARVVTRDRKFHHISPVLCELHRLPDRHPISAYMGWCLHIWPTTANSCRVDHTFGLLSRCLDVPRTRTVFGSWNFAVAGPLMWNSLPANLRQFLGKLRPEDWTSA